MDAERILRELLEKTASEQKYQNYDLEIKPITSGGANYTTELFLVTIKEPKRDDLHIFGKVAVISEDMRNVINGNRLFETERFIYTELIPMFTALMDKHGVPDNERLVFPKFYGYSDKYLEETVLLENLTKKGYGSFSRFESVDWDYASSAISELAKFHALSFACHKEHPERFEKILEKQVFLTSDSNQEEKWKQVVENTIKSAKPEHQKKLIDFLGVYGQKEVFLKFYAPHKAAILSHGDYRQSNLLSKKENGKIHIIPVDYQTVHNGRQTNDLLYFIFTGTDKKFRQQYYQKLIDHYYDELKKALKYLNLDAEVVYPRAQFDEELKETLPYGLLISIFLLPVITVEVENAPRFDGEFKDLEFKTNDLYTERLTGIVEDYIDWGII